MPRFLFRKEEMLAGLWANGDKIGLGFQKPGTNFPLPLMKAFERESGVGKEHEQKHRAEFQMSLVLALRSQASFQTPFGAQFLVYKER